MTDLYMASLGASVCTQARWVCWTQTDHLCVPLLEHEGSRNSKVAGNFVPAGWSCRQMMFSAPRVLQCWSPEWNKASCMSLQGGRGGVAVPHALHKRGTTPYPCSLHALSILLSNTCKANNNAEAAVPSLRGACLLVSRFISSACKCTCTALLCSAGNPSQRHSP